MEEMFNIKETISQPTKILVRFEKKVDITSIEPMYTSLSAIVVSVYLNAKP